MSKEKLIVALDTPDRDSTERLLEHLHGTVTWVKVGFQAFGLFGLPGFKRLKADGYDVFLDLKFHDIPNTTARDVGTMTRHGVQMINMHAGGGIEMMQAARESAETAAADTGTPMPILLGVTVLTSIDEADFQRSFGSERRLTKQVVYLAQLAQEAGLSGVVASPLESEPIRNACGDDFVIVTPGIRPAWAAAGDQRRITTPAEAIRQGASHIVVGRPIIAAADPAAAAERILEEMENVSP